MSTAASLRAVDFRSRRVYQSEQHPSYTSWVSFFPGADGRWYLACEEVTRPQAPLPQCSAEAWYVMGLPAGYDKSQHRMESVLLVSDDLESWREMSRADFRHHHTVGHFGTARTGDGRLHRFVWACYDLDPAADPSRIYWTSDDDGARWQQQPSFHDARFASYPHRLRTLRDGTLVLCVAMAPRFGTPTRPLRTCADLDAVGGMQMMLFHSLDQGRTWQGPLPVLAGQRVSETDFVELPSGDLVLINNSIFAQPGRQVVFRDGDRFTPGPLERARGQTGSREPNMVPETVCRTAEGLLVGCMRAGRYQWSGDDGRTWQPLEGIPEVGPEVYQPWIHCLPDGRLACAGHYGRDAPIHGDAVEDQYVSLHLFRLEGVPALRETSLELSRDRAPKSRRWENAFTLRLLDGDQPLADAEIQMWYVARDQPGYESFVTTPLNERMAQGGKRLRLRTDASGTARAALTEFDGVEDPHRSYQIVARFNADAADTCYRPCQTPQFEFYAVSEQDPVASW